MTTDELRRLYVQTRALNQAGALYGAMLYADGNFMEYLEGPELGMKAARRRILASRRHVGILEMVHEPIPHRSYDGFDLGTPHHDSDPVLTAATHRWARQAATIDDASATGLQLLRHFWDRVR